MKLSEKEKVSRPASSAAPTLRATKELLSTKPSDEAKSVKSPSFRWLKVAAKPYARELYVNACSTSSSHWFYKHEGDSDENNSFIKGYN
jgi:hypothetical protein